jgi:hypothetical protein
MTDARWDLSWVKSIFSSFFAHRNVMRFGGASTFRTLAVDGDFFDRTGKRTGLYCPIGGYGFSWLWFAALIALAVFTFCAPTSTRR